jgi:hypothetical protein
MSIENRNLAEIIADYRRGMTIPRANCDVPMLIDEIERLQKKITIVRGYLLNLPTNFKKAELLNVINNAAQALTPQVKP